MDNTCRPIYTNPTSDKQKEIKKEKSSLTVAQRPRWTRRKSLSTFGWWRDWHISTSLRKVLRSTNLHFDRDRVFAPGTAEHPAKRPKIDLEPRDCPARSLGAIWRTSIIALSSFATRARCAACHARSLHFAENDCNAAEGEMSGRQARRDVRERFEHFVVGFDKPHIRICLSM